MHVLINYRDIDDNLHLVKNYLHAKKSVWNSNYPLKYKGMNIELYAQDSNDSLHSSVGIYSLLNKTWIQNQIQKSYQLMMQQSNKKHNHMNMK